MSLKNAIPGRGGLYGGAKSGLRPPGKLEAGETPKDEIISDFALQTWKYHIMSDDQGKWGGPGCDLNFDESCIQKYLDTLVKFHKIDHYRTATGRPQDKPYNGAAYDINGIAGKGVAQVVKILTNFLKKNKNEFPIIPKKKSYNIAIQGLGAMGKPIFERLTSLGHKVVAVSDLKLSGTLVNENGLDYKMVMKALKSKGNGKNFKIISSDEVLYYDCDILIPAAIGDVITIKNVSKIKAPLIVEAANFPVTNEAIEKLYQNG
ncbi:MAG: hypothetical protein IIA49_04050, partial [Bacteroidetes bacterium]|nr:hypothetical protein [Bacteroidota bacterium]